MTRPLRLEFPGALYHVTGRGDRRHAIYRDDTDRYAWLDVLGLVAARFHFVIHAYCQMGNHYHLMVETTEGNLSQGMRQLNGIYSQRVNRRHGQVGHVFQGRYHALLVQKDAHLLELARYLVLNPVRAGMVDTPDAWHWSSHHCMLDGAGKPDWLEVDWLLGQFGAGRGDAIAAYRQFVAAGTASDSPLKRVHYQLVVGDDDFAARHRRHDGHAGHAGLAAVSRAQRRIAALTLPEYQAAFADRDAAMAHAYRSTVFTMAQIGAHFAVSPRTVGRAVKRFEGSAMLSPCANAGTDPRGE
ncbi:MAG: transposase [Pseudomonadota bacterium]|nr:transposase [Pseudomonadota bacterium]